MGALPDQSIDLILCDLPYGTTTCSWDVVIPMDRLWEHYKRLIKPRGAIVLFGTEPFSSRLRVSNLKWYKYDWYWRKTRPGGFVSAKLKPLKDVETISVFSKGTTANGSRDNMSYYPQGLKSINKMWSRPQKYAGSKGVNSSKYLALNRVQNVTGYPRQVLDFANPNNKVHHPTEKPVALLEYLIRTYSQPNQMVLDNTMGSGSTGVAAKRLKRKFIGIEKEHSFFKSAVGRIKNEPRPSR